MASQGQAGGRSAGQEITVVVNRERKKRITIMQLPSEQSFDKSGHVTLARENNLKEYKSAHNIDTMPTTGAGSEFGREAKEEARRRKYGYIRKNYNPEAQPWLMQVGPEKTSKKFKGTRNGGILENASYFIFTKKPEGFEATPVEEWHNFKPTVSYKNLNAEEAEEEFARRDKNLNMFNIMVRKRLKKDGDEELAVDDKEKVKAEIKSKGLMLTEMEDWADMSDEDGPGDGGHDSDDSISGRKKAGGKGKGKGKKKKEKDSDEEAVEESDDGDLEAKQVDYMSDTSDSDSDLEQREDKTKYEQKGVEDEDGLRDIVVESDNEKDNKEEEKNEKGSDKSSSSSESESDDPDREDNEFTKAFLMTGSKKERGRSPVPPRSLTPTDDKKRKLTSSPGGASPSTKKIKQELVTVNSKLVNAPSLHTDGRPSTPVNNSSASTSRDGLTEETVKRYLMRKPMSSKDLYKIFKSKKLGLTNEQLTVNIANILRKLNTNQQKINGTVHFSINE